NLNGIEGLCDVVVSADIQPKDFVTVLTFCCQQNDGYVVLFSQFRCGGNVVHLWHHHVHEHQMDVVVGKHVQSFFSRKCREDFIIFRRKVNGQCGHNVLFVVTNQDIIHGSYTSKFLLLL